MTRRIALALFALHALTAFAPAPFPRPPRREKSDALTDQWLQGEWQKVASEQTLGDGKKQPHEWVVDSIRVEGRRWTFHGGGTERARVTTVIHLAKTPALLDWHNGDLAEVDPQSRPTWWGAIKRSGDHMIVVYRGGGERVTSFDSPPAGCYLMTMRKVR